MPRRPRLQIATVAAISFAADRSGQECPQFSAEDHRRINNIRRSIPDYHLKAGCIEAGPGSRMEGQSRRGVLDPSEALVVPPFIISTHAGKDCSNFREYEVGRVQIFRETRIAFRGHIAGDPTTQRKAQEAPRMFERFLFGFDKAAAELGSGTPSVSTGDFLVKSANIVRLDLFAAEDAGNDKLCLMVRLTQGKNVKQVVRSWTRAGKSFDWSPQTSGRDRANGWDEATDLGRTLATAILVE